MGYPLSPFTPSPPCGTPSLSSVSTWFACARVCVDVQTKSDHDVAANRTQDNLDKQRKHIEESVKKMTKAASGKGGDQKKSGQASDLAVFFCFFPLFNCRTCV